MRIHFSGSGTYFGSSSTRSVTDSGLSTSKTRQKVSKLSLKYRDTIQTLPDSEDFDPDNYTIIPPQDPMAPSKKRPMVLDLAPDIEDFDLDNYLILSPDNPNSATFDYNNNGVEMRRDSTGELIIQSGQSILKKKKRVTFAISDSDSDDTLDDQSIAQRIKNMRRKKVRTATPPPVNSQRIRKGKNKI